MLNLLKAIIPNIPYVKPLYDCVKEYWNSKQNEKNIIKALINAAIEELRYNGNAGIGSKENPFLVKNIGSLIEYCGSHALNEENKKQLRQYRLDAANSARITVNSSVKPGHVQNRSKELCFILEHILSKL